MCWGLETECAVRFGDDNGTHEGLGSLCVSPSSPSQRQNVGRRCRGGAAVAGGYTFQARYVPVGRLKGLVSERFEEYFGSFGSVVEGLGAPVGTAAERVSADAGTVAWLAEDAGTVARLAEDEPLQERQGHT